ncbi:MAG: alpha/beta fold hydrolase [Micromonosporaceae bacterium]|nr:alpha/beta fold hydrolase [Micromonosporaceae bacterium]
MNSCKRFGVLLVAVVLGAGTAACTASQTPTAGPPSPVVHPTVAAECPDVSTGGQQAWFSDVKGVNIGAVMLGTGSVGVVLAHQADEDSCEWLPYGKELAAAGYKVLAFDFAGSGVSGDLGTDARDANVVAAAGYLLGHGATSIVLLGASMGGNASLVAATKIIPQVAGVISMSAPASYQGLNALSAVANLKAPVLYIAGKDDGTFPDDATAMYNATPINSKKLLIVDSFNHGVALLVPQDPQSRKVRTAITDFLHRYAPANS